MKSRPLLSQMTFLLLDRSRYRDYWLLALICSIPTLLAVVLGVHESFELDGIAYKGWFDAYNFWPMVFVIPAALWTVRRDAEETALRIPGPALYAGAVAARGLAADRLLDVLRAQR